MLPTTSSATNKKPRAARTISALLGWVILAGCSASGPDLLRKGERLIEQGKYSDAITKLEAARALMPQTALVYNQLGLAYHGAGRASEAVQAYGQALKLNRDLYAARYNLGCLQLEQGNYTAAINELTTFTSMQAPVADGWFKLASAQYHAKQFDSAERSLTHGLKLRPKDPAGLNTVGMIRLARRNPNDAVGYFEDALKAQPGYAPALLNLAVTYHQHLNKHALALEKYRAYLALQPRPGNWEAVSQLAQQLAHGSAPPPKAIAPAPTALRTQAPATVKAAPVATAPLSQTNVALTTMVPQTNRSAAKPVSPQTPPKPPTLSSNVVVRATPPPPVPAEKMEVVQIEPDEPIKPAKEVVFAPSSKPAPAPKRTPATVPTPEPVEPEPLTSETTPTQTKRSGFFQRLNPVRWFSSSEESKTGKSTESVSPPKQTAAWSGSVGTELPEDAGLARSASPEISATTSEGGTAPSPRYKYLRPSSPIGGNRAEADRRFSRGAKYQRDGKLTPAVTEYLAAIEADGSFFEAHYNLGLAAFEQGNMNRSLSAYEHALSIKPTHVDARFNFALALQKAGFARDAANELEKLLAEHPDETRAHLTLANLFAQQLGQPVKAREHYKRLLDLEPRHPQAAAVRYWISTHP